MAAASSRRLLNSAVPVRHRPRSLLLLAVVLSFLLETSSSSSSLSTSALLGVHPQDENYFSGSLFACRDGSGSFPKHRLNDDFCDCPDGTDEPGTSACPESTFYCKNLGDLPLTLFSSRVNDHICDCCDGSDEYDGGIICPNTCLNDGDALFNRKDTHDPMEMKLDNLNTRERKNRVDLEDLIQKFKGLRLVVLIEIVVAICMVTFCLSCRRVRSQRKRILWRNRIGQSDL